MKQILKQHFLGGVWEIRTIGPIVSCRYSIAYGGAGLWNCQVSCILCSPQFEVD